MNENYFDGRFEMQTRAKPYSVGYRHPAAGSRSIGIMNLAFCGIDRKDGSGTFGCRSIGLGILQACFFCMHIFWLQPSWIFLARYPHFELMFVEVFGITIASSFLLRSSAFFAALGQVARHLGSEKLCMATEGGSRCLCVYVY